MNYLQLVGNPRRRHRKHKAKSRRRASRKQLAARKRFAAMSRSRSRRRHHSAPVMANPRRRSRRHVVVHSRRRHRRNPIMGGGMRNMGGLFRSAALGATGAIVNDIAYGFATPFLPAALVAPAAAGSPNYVYTLGKSGMAILLGMVLRKVPGVGSRAVHMTEGALTVTFHDLLKQMITSFGIAVPMGDAMMERGAPPNPSQQRLRMYPGGGATPLKMYPGGAATSAREAVTR